MNDLEKITSLIINGMILDDLKSYDLKKKMEDFSELKIYLEKRGGKLLDEIFLYTIVNKRINNFSGNEIVNLFFKSYQRILMNEEILLNLEIDNKKMKQYQNLIFQNHLNSLMLKIEISEEDLNIFKDNLLFLQKTSEQFYYEQYDYRVLKSQSQNYISHIIPIILEDYIENYKIIQKDNFVLSEKAQNKLKKIQGDILRYITINIDKINNDYDISDLLKQDSKEILKKFQYTVLITLLKNKKISSLEIQDNKGNVLKNHNFSNIWIRSIMQQNEIELKNIEDALDFAKVKENENSCVYVLTYYKKEIDLLLLENKDVAKNKESFVASLINGFRCYLANSEYIEYMNEKTLSDGREEICFSMKKEISFLPLLSYFKENALSDESINLFLNNNVMYSNKIAQDLIKKERETKLLNKTSITNNIVNKKVKI